MPELTLPFAEELSIRSQHQRGEARLLCSLYQPPGPVSGKGRNCYVIASDPGYMNKNIRKFRTDEFDNRYVKQTEVLTHVTHVTGRFPTIRIDQSKFTMHHFTENNSFVHNKHYAYISVHIVEKCFILCYIIYSALNVHGTAV